jgi:transposase-like protein
VLLVERGGRAHAVPTNAVKTQTLREELSYLADRDSALFTDEFRIYTLLGREFARGHHVTNHHSGEYVHKMPNGEMIVTTNTAESFFALLKRGHYGTFHRLSKKHLHRYMTEFGFRWNDRNVSDGERIVAAIRGAEGRRLRYT